jgi:hypothetical protein
MLATLTTDGMNQVPLEVLAFARVANIDAPVKGRMTALVELFLETQTRSGPEQTIRRIRIQPSLLAELLRLLQDAAARAALGAGVMPPLGTPKH